MAATSPDSPALSLTAKEILRPESSRALQEIAADLRSTSLEAQSTAMLRALDTLDANKDRFEQSPQDPRQTTVNCAAFLLEAGILAPLAVGLRTAAAGQWLVYTAEDADPLVRSWASDCAKVLYCLTEDKRTFRAIRASVPDLLDLLTEVYLRGVECPVSEECRSRLTEEAILEVKQWARANILSCLAHLSLWSHKLRLRCARHTELLNAILVHTSQDVSDVEFLHDAFLLLCHVYPLWEDPDLDGWVLYWISNIIHSAAECALIESACYLLCLLTQGDDRRQRLAGPSAGTYLLPLCHILAAVPASPNPAGNPTRSLKMLGTTLGVAIQDTSGAKAAGRNAVERRRHFEKEARKDGARVQRAQQLAAIVSEPHFNRVLPIVKRHGEKYPVKDATVAPRLGWLDARAKRSCSATGCSKKEKKPGEFKSARKLPGRARTRNGARTYIVARRCIKIMKSTPVYEYYKLNIKS
ncbi:hypothetical protein KFL_001010300 [Klebsormidium nitens]|uniref:Uncharacterized protein n=1 Tax=Klebsormidium nitens TaxID=105231 RepID=A0A1Y1HU38_KLENI|nr:hypothetical protein KFL_001010300 [Klebsormidium nitens]|eukprot:GAQ82145.1 hypothetical protein KFL_001010300 [Klebsormidium nitens]